MRPINKHRIRTGLMLAFNFAMSMLKYFIALFMLYTGIATALSEPEPRDGDLGFLFDNHISLALFGSVFFISGLTLFVAKLRRSDKYTGRGLMAIFLCFTFVAILNFAALGLESNWLPNALAGVIVGVLWLRWKYIDYTTPHFRDIIRRKKILD